MYERFTDRARKVMQLANQEAHGLGHPAIGTEHILLGLVKEGSGVGACVLKNLDIDLEKVRLEIEKLVWTGLGAVPGAVAGKLPQTPAARKVIEAAVLHAAAFHHNYVGTEHLLMGLLAEGEGVAAQVLMNLGLSRKRVEDEMLALLGHPKEGCFKGNVTIEPGTGKTEFFTKVIEYSLNQSRPLKDAAEIDLRATRVAAEVIEWERGLAKIANDAAMSVRQTEIIALIDRRIEEAKVAGTIALAAHLLSLKKEIEGSQPGSGQDKV